MCDHPHHLRLNIREVEDLNELSYTELIERQLAEILGEDNLQYATNVIGRTPTVGELVAHYCANGGPEDFERRHGRKTCINSCEPNN